jgi:hypothetical protein
LNRGARTRYFTTESGKLRIVELRIVELRIVELRIVELRIVEVGIRELGIRELGIEGKLDFKNSQFTILHS